MITLHEEFWSLYNTIMINYKTVDPFYLNDNSTLHKVESLYLRFFNGLLSCSCSSHDKIVKMMANMARKARENG